MTPNRTHALPLLALLLTLCASAAAGPAWYQVELLLFLNGGRGATEALQEVRDPPSPAGAVEVQQPRSADQAFALVGKDAQSLGPQQYTLDRSGHYQTLLHLAWRQPIGGERGAQKVYFQLPPPDQAPGIAPQAPPPRLAGTLIMSRGHYLHATLDVVYREPLPRDAGSGNAPGYRLYHMQEQRRMRSDELNYIDHPAIGALLLVHPLAPTPATDATPPGSDAEAPPPGEAPDASTPPEEAAPADQGPAD